MDELFKSKPGRQSLPLEEERDLIARAQEKDADATWALLVQYRGLLQKTSAGIRSRVGRQLTPERLEDLQADLVLAAVDAIQKFDTARFVRLSQVLPNVLQKAATKVEMALATPRSTLALWFKIWRQAEQDLSKAAQIAPEWGMSIDTFRAIEYSLANADYEWVQVPFSSQRVPTADEATYKLAHAALDTLSPSEREVVELLYGFRGYPKSDQEVALIRETSPRTVKEQRQRALQKMRNGLGITPA
jgi:RNA polymerase sigma factor (sigma-70 family)